MTPDQYIELVETQLLAEGAEVSRESINDTSALVAYRTEFRLSWLASRLYLFTVVVGVPVATVTGLEQLTKDALAYAIARKGRFRGLQRGVAAIPVLVGKSVDVDARAYAETRVVRRRGAFSWPAAVDLSARTVHRHQGRVFIGGLYSSWLISQTDLALPIPPN